MLFIPCNFAILRLLLCFKRPLFNVFIALDLNFRSCNSINKGGISAYASLIVLWQRVLIVLDSATIAALNCSSLSIILVLQ